MTFVGFICSWIPVNSGEVEVIVNNNTCFQCH